MKRGDVWPVGPDPTAGHERKGGRPVPVVSPAAFGEVTGTPVVPPITTGGDFARRRGCAVPLENAGTRTAGVIRCDRPRAIDPRRGGTAGVWKRSPTQSLTMCSPGSIPSSHRQHGQPMSPLSREGPSCARCPPRFHFPYAETPAYASAGKCLTFGSWGIETVAGWLPASLAGSRPEKAAGVWPETRAVW